MEDWKWVILPSCPAAILISIIIGIGSGFVESRGRSEKMLFHSKSPCKGVAGLTVMASPARFFSLLLCVAALVAALHSAKPGQAAPPIKPSDVPERYFILSLSGIPIGSVTISHSQEQDQWVARKRFVLMDPFRGPQVSLTTLRSNMDLSPISYSIQRFSDGRAGTGEEGVLDKEGGMILVRRTDHSGPSMDGDQSEVLVPGGASIHQAPLPWVFDDLLAPMLMMMKPCAGEAKVVRVFDISMKGVYPLVTHYFEKTARGGEEFWKATRSDFSGKMNPILLTWDHMPVAVNAAGFDFRLATRDQVEGLEKVTFDPSQSIPVINPPKSSLRGRSGKWAITLQGASAESLSEALIEACPYQKVTSQGTGRRVVDLRIPHPTGKDSHPLDQDMARWTAPTDYAQSRDPAIRAAVKRACKGKKSLTRKVGRILKWVDEKILQSEGINFASALETLRRGAGDCTEKSVLAVAMLRAAGIPARAVYGLTYHGGAMHHHMWVEVHNGRAWIPGDPSSREWPAGPGHIRFAVIPLGGRDYSMVARLLMTKVGRMEIEYLGIGEQ